MHNSPVPSFGPLDASFLIVGLAPGLKGANFSGRPFTGDFAGIFLYGALLQFGFAKGSYGASIDDGLFLTKTRITNAVRCVPPQNKPVGIEIVACRRFLSSEIKAMPRLKIVLALGLIAHDAVLAALNLRKSAYKFAHGAFHALPPGLTLADSYHCSRYNTNTGRLTVEMFHSVFSKISKMI